MKSHEFTLVLRGAREVNDEIADRLFEAGCDDGLPGSRDGAVFLDFDRRAESLPEAVLSAIRDVRNADVDLSAARIEPDDFVTGAEIARRLGRSRESVRLLIRGQRGPGQFPLPVASLKGKSRVWSWAEVVHWLVRGGIVPSIGAEQLAEARFVAVLNRALRQERGGTEERWLPEIVETLRRLRNDPARTRLPRRVSRSLASVTPPGV